MTSPHDPQSAPGGPLDDLADGSFAGAHDRRRFLKRAAVAGAATWVAPTVLSAPAFAQGSTACTGPQGFFTWNRAAYTNAQRSGAPGAGGDMLAGWTSHPTFTDTLYTTATPVTVSYQLLGTTFLNTNAAVPEGHGVSTAGGSATFKSYRISKDANPTLGDVMTIIIQFSADVGCPTIVIGDIDNSLAAGVNGCTGSGGTGAAWADRLSATGYPGVNATGTPVTVTRIAGTGGSNVTPGVGSTGPWTAVQCASIPQSSTVSDLTLQVGGVIRELRLEYFSNFFDTSGNGNQHIALGDITFYL